MLRNLSGARPISPAYSILNEVLSLNAQEFVKLRLDFRVMLMILNEVLSLNAQEYFTGTRLKR